MMNVFNYSYPFMLVRNFTFVMLDEGLELNNELDVPVERGNVHCTQVAIFKPVMREYLPYQPIRFLSQKGLVRLTATRGPSLL